MMGTAPSGNAVTVDGVAKRIATVTEVDGVSRAAAPGDAVALLGPYGAGESNLARMPCVVRSPDGGHR